MSDIQTKKITASVACSILFVDDEEQIVNIIQASLPFYGIRVAGFTSPQQALQEFKRSSYKYDLLVTDQSMHCMTGTELIQACKKIKADLPSIIFTGNDRQETLSSASVKIDEVVTKPLQIKALVAVIYKVLNEQL